MPAFSPQRRQRIIDDYLAQTQRNTFKPGEFIDWLADKPDHEAYNAFYAIDEAEAARAYRIELARRFISGLRVSVTEQEDEGEPRAVNVTFQEAPAFMSPLSGRTTGGGYVALNLEDADSRSMFREEAAAAFKAWERRYAAVLTQEELTSAARLREGLVNKVVPA